jgi:hypothetical protein
MYIYLINNNDLKEMVKMENGVNPYFLNKEVKASRKGSVPAGRGNLIYYIIMYKPPRRVQARNLSYPGISYSGAFPAGFGTNWST